MAFGESILLTKKKKGSLEGHRVFSEGTKAQHSPLWTFNVITAHTVFFLWRALHFSGSGMINVNLWKRRQGDFHEGGDCLPSFLSSSIHTYRNNNRRKNPQGRIFILIVHPKFYFPHQQFMQYFHSLLHCPVILCRVSPLFICGEESSPRKFILTVPF